MYNYCVFSLLTVVVIAKGKDRRSRLLRSYFTPLHFKVAFTTVSLLYVLPVLPIQDSSATHQVQ